MQNTLDYERIAEEYLTGEPLPASCHEHLAHYIRPRADVIFGELRIVVSSTEDPYDNVAGLITDVRSGLLRLGPSPCVEDGTHPTWTRNEFLAYRAWHDVEGHATIGASFDRYGELQVLRAHVHALTSARCRLNPSQAAGAISAVYNEVIGRVACGVTNQADAPHRPTRLGTYGKQVVSHLAAI